MRIALVSEHASPLAALGTMDAGGQNVLVAQLAIGLAARGHDVVVYTRRDDPALDDRVLMGPGVVVEHVNAGPPVAIPKDDLFPQMAPFANALLRRWRQSRPDVVHAHFWMSGWASSRACSTLGLPMVQTFHALGEVKHRHLGSRDPSPPQRRRIEREITQAADAVIASCRDERAELLRLGANPGSVHIVPCGVDIDVFTPGRSPSLNDHPQLLCVSRLTPRKGIDDAVRVTALLEGARLLVLGGPAAHALGDDPEYARLSRLARELGITERVSFAGGVDRTRVAQAMRAADVVLALPWYEPFGIVPVEAMACGKAVVGTAVGGLLDTVVDGVTGALVPPRRPELAAAAVQSILDNPLRRRAMERASLRRARALYPWSAVVAGTEQVYQHVVEQAVALERTS